MEIYDDSPILKSLMSVQVGDGKGKWSLKPYLDKHFKNYHIFLNVDFTYSQQFFSSGGLCKVIELQPYHKVHIFISRINDSIENGAFRDFVMRAAIVTRKTIIIHIPKRQQWLIEAVSEQLDKLSEVNDDDNLYRVILEKDNVVTHFQYEDPHSMDYGNFWSEPVYFAVYWGPSARICCEPFVKSNTKTNEDINNG